jgi:hypothetical protein
VTRRVLVPVTSLLALLAGCGIAPDSQPRDVATKDRPFTLSSDESIPPETTAAPGNPKVYLVDRSDHVVGSNRDVSSLTDLLRALLKGPTTQDNVRGFTSAIPLNTTLVDSHIDAKILTISLKTDPNSQGFGGANGPKAFAQLVYTAMGDPDKVRGVRFVVDNHEVGIDGDGKRVVDHPLTKNDFSKQAPAPGSDLKQPGGSLVTTTTSPLPPATTSIPTTATSVPTTVTTAVAGG